MISRQCNNCQEEYQANPSYLKRGQGQYCSRRCSGAANGRGRRKNPDPNTQCATCDKEFYRQNSHKKSKSGLYFCSIKCQNFAFKAESNIAVTTGPAPTVNKRGKRNCITCDKLGYYTYQECQQCSKNSTIVKWLQGDISITWISTSKETKKFVKQYMLNIRGDKCEQCGFDKQAKNGRSIIQLDHIDGNYQNNNILNLRLLCPNCHALTDNYGSLNKSGGRRYRKLYYS